MLARCLDGEITPSLQRLGFATETVANPAGAGPMLIAQRREPGNRTTVLGYGHGDVIRGLEAEWAECSENPVICQSDTAVTPSPTRTG
jgi:hypothetical protein